MITLLTFGVDDVERAMAVLGAHAPGKNSSSQFGVKPARTRQRASFGLA